MTMFTEANLIGRRHERELVAKGDNHCRKQLEDLLKKKKKFYIRHLKS